MEKQGEHFVYILKCKDSSFYTGYTTDLKKRLSMHDSGKGAKYTRGRGPFSFVYYKSFSSKSEAMQMEYKIKQLTRKQKEQLIISFKEGKDDNE